MFRWKKYDLVRRDFGYFTQKLSFAEMKKRYPECVSFHFQDTGYGTYEAYGYEPRYITNVKSNNMNEYPREGISGGFYYVLID